MADGDFVVLECPATPEAELVDSCPATPDRGIKLQVASVHSSSSENEDDSTNMRGETGEQNFTTSDCNDDTADGKKSPPPNCAICLGKCKNKCFTDSCLHQFCFKCLLEWSKIKAECPLCKQPFKSIIHNVRSINQFDEYLVRPTGPSRIRSLGPQTATQLIRLYEQMWRFVVYERKLFAIPVSDITGRFRSCDAEFFRENPAQYVRLVPFINRDMVSLCPNVANHQSYHDCIRLALNTYNMRSSSFRREIQYIFRHHTEHFQHELYNFARSPFDVVGYDQTVSYESHDFSPIYTMTSDSDEADPSPNRGRILDMRTHMPTPYRQIEMILRSIPFPIPPVAHVHDPTLMNIRNMHGPPYLGNETPGPSGMYGWPARAFPQPALMTRRQPRVSPPLFIVSSDSEDDCQFVMALKPPHLRTPEQVNLTTDDEDSDVVFVAETFAQPKTQDSETEMPVNNEQATSSLTDGWPQIPVDYSIHDDTIAIDTIIRELTQTIAVNAEAANAGSSSHNSQPREPIDYDTPSTSRGHRDQGRMRSSAVRMLATKAFSAKKRKALRKLQLKKMKVSSSDEESSTESSDSCSSEPSREVQGIEVLSSDSSKVKRMSTRARNNRAKRAKFGSTFVSEDQIKTNTKSPSKYGPIRGSVRKLEPRAFKGVAKKFVPPSSSGSDETDEDIKSLSDSSD